MNTFIIDNTKIQGIQKRRHNHNSKKKVHLSGTPAFFPYFMYFSYIKKTSEAIIQRRKKRHTEIIDLRKVSKYNVQKVHHGGTSKQVLLQFIKIFTLRCEKQPRQLFDITLALFTTA